MKLFIAVFLLTIAFILPAAAQKRNQNNARQNVGTTAKPTESPTPQQIKRQETDWSPTFYMMLFFGIAIYFIPAIYAIGNKHPQSGAITALNILLGWTFIGWAIALVWALALQKPPKPDKTVNLP